MVKAKKSIITAGMQKRASEVIENKGELSPEQEDFINKASLVVNDTEEQQKQIPAKRGRKPCLVKKQKMTFELAEDLVNELDEVVKSLGMTRASFMAQAVMKAVKEAQNN